MLCPLLADKLVHNFGAALALDIAAPVELTVAALHYLCLVLVIAPPTAHELAAVHALRGLVTEASHGAQRTRALVLQTIVRTGLQIHQVVARWGIKFTVELNQFSTRVELHGGGTVVLLLQSISHLPEVSKLQPTSLQTARPRHTVTFTGHMSQV